MGQKMETWTQADGLRWACDQLRTPMTALVLAMQRLEEVGTEEERRQFWAMAKRSQRELGRAVAAVLEEAQAEQRRER